jgi:hypothetical protein
VVGVGDARVVADDRQGLRLDHQDVHLAETRAGNIVTNIDWSAWNGHSAVGEGEWGYDNCIPDCAQGIVKDYPATITLSGVSDGHFTQLTEYQSGPFGDTFTFPLPVPSFRASS